MNRKFIIFILFSTGILQVCTLTEQFPSEEPIASFEILSNQNGLVSFRNTSQFASSYQWDFGDGDTSTELTPTHAYTSEGSFTATLTAMNDISDATSNTSATISTRAFISTWRTTSSNDSITIPTAGSGYNYTVNWGDGNMSAAQTADATHIYVTAGTYTVSILGAFPSIRFADFDVSTGDNSTKIHNIRQWGDVQWTSLNTAFAGCSNLMINASDIPDLSSVTNMNFMFSGATALNQDISNWDVANVTNMSGVFLNATAFNQDISNWDVANVTNMRFMFNGATAFNQDISNWDVANVTDMRFMFNGATAFNQDISNWNVTNVVDMRGIFLNATAFNQDISSWNVANVIDMSFMFSGATAFNQDISSWNIVSASDMFGMFTNVTLSTENYDALLIGWSSSSVLVDNVIFDAGGSRYTAGGAAEAARRKLIYSYLWVITDGGPN